MLLLCSSFRLEELFQVKNGLTTLFLFFFLEMPKISVDRTMLNREKKEDGLTCRLPQILRPRLRAFFFFFNESTTYSYIDRSRHHKSNWKTKVGGSGKEER